MGVKKVKIEIKHWLTGMVLFEFEAEGNTLERTIREANLYGADLHGADLYGADLYGADLRGADLYGANLRGANLHGANLRGANLYGADLRGADLHGADLYGANLRGANLYGANLHGADLHGADLYGADLRGANLYGADLRGADLHGADLYGANLHGADLHGADLYGADLYGADLRGAKNSEYAAAQTIIVPEGTLIGWKKAYVNGDAVIVKLSIPEDARRSNATGRKCRAERAEVLGIYPVGKKRALAKATVANSGHDNSFTYKTGETVEPTEPFAEDRFDECAPGIHFFITRLEAEDY